MKVREIKIKNLEKLMANQLFLNLFLERRCYFLKCFEGGR